MQRGSVLLSTGLVLCTPIASSGEWPQWRGPNRDGSIEAPALTGKWPADLPLLWTRDVGEGYSGGPVVSGDGLWVHTRRGEKEVVSRLRLSTGETVWSEQYDAPFRQDHDALSHGRGPYSTPSLASGHLFTFGVTAILSAWDAGSGKLLWRKDSADEFDPSFPYFGAAASPLVWGELCIVHLGGHERGSIETPAEGAMVALRVSDGREEWRWRGDGPALGASPLVREIAGRSQLIFKTKQKMVGLDPRTGRELWQMPYRVSQDNTIVTPLLVGDRLLTSDYDAGMSAWGIRGNGEMWVVRQLWKTRQASLFMSSPVLANGLLVGFSHFRRGQLFVLDPDDGNVVWRGEPRSGEHASLISWGDEVFAFLADGSLVVGDVSNHGLVIKRKYRLGKKAGWAHPALADGHVVVKEGSRLAVYRLD